ncbi:peptidoglycan D,D-transpeptidase FtsI family protein [Paeniglutamicibacter psychrophenolicus]|uniref:peptidoglycan D,D-transpeptidase FtsI family protein n=1 Tax=Paeniglutamicibacter psychrophenolicus TaxID=257454 RepID=UPI0027889668|nr:penicillin-binding protein 2 [Paeniglutamicibacter psychrophenolicus]MDQ0094376.1 cell division protein FtsI (penicillin-binding protein 3) [Paeniglutamicibacter psychrophenolicus]
MPPKSPTTGTTHLRLRMVVAISLVLLLITGGRLFFVQSLNAKAVAAEAVDNRTRFQETQPRRGQILDSKGTILATSVDRYDLVIDQRKVDADKPIVRKKLSGGTTRESVSIEQAVGELAQLIDQDIDTVRTAIVGDPGAKKNAYSVVAKGVTPEVRNSVMELRIPTLTGQLRSERQYPNGVVAGPLLGFVMNTDDQQSLKGAEGLEMSQDKRLTGTPGTRTYEVGADGVRIPVAETTEVPAVDGQDVKLTLDADINFIAQEEALKKQKQFNAEWVSVIVEEVKTGRLIAIGDSNQLDPNDPSATEATFRRSASITQAFEPGSTGKVPTFAAALEEGVVKPTDAFKVPNAYTINKETINDSLKHSTYDMTVAGIFARSYNTGTVMIGNKMSNETRYKYMKKFGLGKAIDIGLSGASQGILAKPQDWERRQQYATMFGQAYTQTALHTAQITQAIANGGVRIDPTLIDSYVNPDGTIEKPAAPKSERVVSAKTSKEMLRLMETVVLEGTGTKMAVSGYRVGGKSGTGQAAGPNGGYDGYTNSFAGVAPLDDPQIAVVVTMYRPKGDWKSWSVGDTFSEVMGKTLNAYNVPPSNSKPNGYDVFIGSEQKKSW